MMMSRDYMSIYHDKINYKTAAGSTIPIWSQSHTCAVCALMPPPLLAQCLSCTCFCYCRCCGAYRCQAPCALYALLAAPLIAQRLLLLETRSCPSCGRASSRQCCCSLARSSAMRWRDARRSCQSWPLRQWELQERSWRCVCADMWAGVYASLRACGHAGDVWARGRAGRRCAVERFVTFVSCCEATEVVPVRRGIRAPGAPYPTIHSRHSDSRACRVSPWWHEDIEEAAMQPTPLWSCGAVTVLLACIAVRKLQVGR
ncbi:hypothetical protein BJV78DRAFT_1256626 [Lactifluus subvellereus]|nr:hypothetical protein BJV78DRAFT_1256626 [Lactifluus subvellereus]